MRISSGVTDKRIYFVAVDPADFTSRETGLTTFTVYRSRDGGTATLMSSPTVAELSAANMPGVYSLLLDEDMTIDSGDDTQELCYHITQASMAPVTRTIELYRPKITAGNTLVVTAGGLADITQAAADKAWSTAARILTASTNFNDISEANVLTQMNAALDATISELGVGIPVATPSIRTALMLVYMGLRNKVVVQTSATDALEFYNDGGTIICKKLLTDDGSDYEEAEMISG